MIWDMIYNLFVVPGILCAFPSYGDPRQLNFAVKTLPSLSFFQEQMAASECPCKERGAGDKEVLPSLPLLLLLLSSPSLSSHP